MIKQLTIKLIPLAIVVLLVSCNGGTELDIKKVAKLECKVINLKKEMKQKLKDATVSAEKKKIRKTFKTQIKEIEEEKKALEKELKAKSKEFDRKEYKKMVEEISAKQDCGL